VADEGRVLLAEIQLPHDEDWKQHFSFTLQEPGENKKVSFLLYRGDQEEPYRELHLWITARPIGVTGLTPTPGAFVAPSPVLSPTVETSPTSAPAETAAPVPTQITTPSPVPTEEPAATETAPTLHTVQPGETLSSIARDYGVSYQAILDANGLEDPNLIRVGQELIIPIP